MLKNLRALFLSLFLIILLVSTGCSSNTTSDNTAGKITVGLHTEPERIDPTWEATLSSVGLMSNIYEPLVVYNVETKKFEPKLAAKWERIDDLTWVFTLRPNVKLHDGNTFTAQDVKFSLDRILDPKFNSRLRTQASVIKSVEVVDDTTVKITTKEKYAPLLARIATFQLIGKASAAKYDANEIVTPAGTGPFKLTKWDKQQQIVLEKNKDYWGSLANVDTVTLRVIPNLATRIAELKAGSIDIATGLSPDALNEIKQQPNLKTVTAPSNLLFIGVNSFEAPLNNKKVRQALSYAVDAKTIADKLYGGLASVENEPVTSRAVGYNPDVQPYEYNPAKAKALLAEAGFPDGFTLQYNGTTGKYLLDKELAEIVAQQLAAVGVKVDIHLDEYATYWKNFLAKQHKGLYNAAIGNPMEDADFVLDLHFYSKGRGLYFNTPEIDNLIEQSRATLETEKRQEVNNRLMSKIHDEVPWLIALETKDIYGVAARVDWQPGSYGTIYFGNLKLQNK